MTLKIERSEQPGLTILTLSGRLDAEHIPEMERLFGPRTGCCKIIVDLKEIRLADRAAVRFLARCEVDGMKLENCPAYIREWMQQERPERE